MEQVGQWVDYFQTHVEPHLAPPRDQGLSIIPYIGLVPTTHEVAEPILWSVVLEPANVSRQFRCLAGMMLTAWNAEDKRAGFMAELEAELLRCGPHVPRGEATAVAQTTAVDSALEHIISLINLDTDNAFAFFAYERPGDQEWIIHRASQDMECPSAVFNRVYELLCTKNTHVGPVAMDLEEAVAEAREDDDDEEEEPSGEDVSYTHPLFTPQTTRGTGADIIIVDEAAHVEQDLFYKVIVPILQLKNTCLLALSSPEGDSNYYSTLMNLRDEKTGEMFFKVVDCVLVCEDCKKKDRVEWLNCNHLVQPAFWLDNRKSHRIKMLYKSNPALGAREMQGVVVSDYMPCFQRHEVERK